MKIHVTSCQTIGKNGQTVDICPFINNHVRMGKYCKLGAVVGIYSCVVINFIPSDCPLREERTYVAMEDNQKLKGE